MKEDTRFRLDRRRTLVLAFLALVPMLGIAWVCNRAEGDGASVVRPVESRYVCMVNNRVYDVEQIPVQVGDHVYYGCCEGCKARLAADRAIRQAVDPVSGRPVDKATAVAGALADGRVLYFESEKNLRAFRPRGG